MACRVVANGSRSAVAWINTPDPWWLQGDRGETAGAGGWLRVLGKCLDFGGGIVYFPACRYGVQGEISVPARTVLRGEGTGLVVLWWGAGRFNLDGGSARGLAHDESAPKPPGTLISGRHFGIEDMSLYLPPFSRPRAPTARSAMPARWRPAV